MLAKSPGCKPTAHRVKKIIYDAAESEDFDREEVATYEEVRESGFLVLKN